MTRLAPLLLLPFLVACEGGEKADSGLPEGDATAGADLYTSNCSSCHGADGEGGFGPALTHSTHELSEADLADVIVNGQGDDMPGFNVSDQEVADVIAYLATFAE